MAENNQNTKQKKFSHQNFEFLLKKCFEKGFSCGAEISGRHIRYRYILAIVESSLTLLNHKKFV